MAQRDARERFLTKVSKKTNGCWEWTKYSMPNGYGQFYLNGKLGYAHRAAWLLFRGPIPNSRFVLHSCDNRKCVNPAHLFVGTHADNMDDMCAKGRAARKLTAEDVLEIRKSELSQLKLAAQFGVAKFVIHQVQHRNTWKHI